MATREIELLTANVAPDDSGDCFWEPFETAMALATATFGQMGGFTFLAPTGADIGLNDAITIPTGYVGTPVLVIQGFLGEAANTLAFTAKQVSIADTEAGDQAFEVEDTVSNAVWTGYAAEDLITLTIPLTPAAPYQEGDVVPFFLGRDDDVDNQTGEFHLFKLLFRYADA